MVECRKGGTSASPKFDLSQCGASLELFFAFALDGVLDSLGPGLHGGNVLGHEIVVVDGGLVIDLVDHLGQLDGDNARDLLRGVIDL